MPPFSGSGSFTVYTPGNPVVTGTVLDAAVQNATNTDFATGLSNAVTRDGQSPATANLPMGGFKLTGLGTATTAGDAIRYEQIVQIQPISASVASSALTISASALFLDFRSATLGSGAVTKVAGTPSDLVISSGSTLGTTSAVLSRIAIIALNNAGTIELAAVNAGGSVVLDEGTRISTTAEGGVGGADSASVAYSATARASLAFRVIGYVESTQATAGTWATAPSKIQGNGGGEATAYESSGGSALVGFLQAGTGAVARSVQSKERDVVSVFDFMTSAQVADVMARTATLDVTAAIQAALNCINTVTVGSFELKFPDGTYSVTAAGARILQIQSGCKLIGSSLEGTQILVAAGSTATALIEDNGSAAKVEIYNITFNGNSNASLTSGVRLGRRTTQWGTYGSMDNVMVRNMPNAIAYDVNCNIVVCGKLYTLTTKSGLIHNSAGSGLHIESFTPYGFSDIGLQMATSDSCNFVEAEAPTVGTAVPLVFEAGGSVKNFMLSVQAGLVVKTPVRVNAVLIGGANLGQTNFIRGDSTARFGDSASPADSGTASSSGTNTLVTTKSWTQDQWKGAALFLTGGTGSGEWFTIASNTKTTLTITNSSWPAAVPDATTTYALDYFIKKAAGGGYSHSVDQTFIDVATQNISVSGTARAATMTVGSALNVKEQQLQGFCLRITNTAGVIQHRITDAYGTGLAAFSNKITAAAAALTTTPTGADAVTAFAAGGKIGGTNTNVFWLDTAAQIALDGLLMVHIGLNTTTTAFNVSSYVLSINIDGVTRVRIGFAFTNTTTGAALALTAANIGAGTIIDVSFLGFIA